MGKVNCYSNILKKGTYFSFIIPSVNNIYCADNSINELLKEYRYFKDTKNDFIKKLINNKLLPKEKDWGKDKFEYNINTVLDAINKYKKDNWTTDEIYNTTYKEYIETFKKHYLLCYFKEEISKGDLFKLLDKDNKQIFTEDDFKTYNKNKKIIEENEVFKNVKKNILSIADAKNVGGFYSSGHIYNNTYSEKYKKICSSYNNFFISIYFEQDWNNKDIYIKVYDYGYPNADIEKVENYLILKNLDELSKTILNLKIKKEPLPKNDYYNLITNYLNFTGRNEEKFKKLREFNVKLENINKKLKDSYDKNSQKIKDGNFNIKEEIKIYNFVDIENEIKEISDEKYNISSEFDSFINSCPKENSLLTRLNFEKFKENFLKLYIDKRDELIKNFKNYSDNINNSITDLTKKINDFKNKISELKTKINNLNEINNILDESLKNTDINKYNDDFFNKLLFKNLKNCEDSIKLLEGSINNSFNSKKTSLKTKYDGIKKLNDLIQKVENIDYKSKIDPKYDTENFFEILTIKNINTIEAEINTLEAAVKKASEDYNNALQKKLENDRKDAEKAAKIKEAEDKKTVIESEIKNVCDNYLTSIKNLTITENFDKNTITTDLDNKINEYYTKKGYGKNNLTGWETVNDKLLATIQQLKSDCINKCNDEIDKKLKEIADKKAKELEEQQRLANEEAAKKAKEEQEEQEEQERLAKEEQDKLNNNNNNNNNEGKQNTQNEQNKIETNTGKKLTCSNKCSKKNDKLTK